METTSKVKKRNRKQTTLDLLNATADLLTGDGSSIPTIAAVAKLAGCDKVLIYRYFGDTHGLLKTLGEHFTLYPAPWQAPSDSSHHNSQSSFLLELKNDLTTKLQAMPLAQSLITHRWYKRNNPLGKALHKSRQRWLQATNQQLSQRIADPAISHVIQLLAEENDTAADAWLAAQPLLPNALLAKEPALPSSSAFAFKEDVLPDNLL